MRCPVCFSRDIDVLMIFGGNDFHYCPKCSFQGLESEARGLYRDIQKKFPFMGKRLTLSDRQKL